MQGDSAAHSEDRAAILLRSVAEQLKLPLSTIARQAELGHFTGDMHAVDVTAIHTNATAALTLVESYLLGLQLMQEQSELLLEPVSVSSLLVDAAHSLSAFAKQYGVALELDVAGKYEPVMAHRQALSAALIALGFALVEGYPLEAGRLTLAVHRTPHGIITGIYGDYEHLSSEQWRNALALQGRANRPFTAVCQGTGAGIFVAESILRAMSTRLRVGKHRRKRGLAATLQPSQQLQLV